MGQKDQEKSFLQSIVLGKTMTGVSILLFPSCYQSGFFCSLDAVQREWADYMMT